MDEGQTCAPHQLSPRTPARNKTHALVKLDRLIHLPREPIDEEEARLGRCGGDGGAHGVLEELDRHFHGDDLALFDVVLDEGSESGARAGLFGAEEVASWDWVGLGRLRDAERRDEPERWMKPKSATRRAH